MLWSPRTLPRHPGREFGFAGWLLALVVAGCQQQDAIREYTVPRTIEQGSLWSFKLLGPDAAVAASKPELQKFVESVQFDPRTGYPQWTLPAGWTEQSGQSSVRYATLKLPGDAGLEVAVTQTSSQIPPSRDDIVLYANMLRTQVGLDEVEAASSDAAELAERFTAGDHSGRLFDFTGLLKAENKSRVVAAMVAVPIVPTAVAPESRREFPLAYTTPPEWSEAPQTQFSVVSMTAGDGDAVASMTITPAMGRPIDNVNRWRGQVKLDPVSEADLVNELSPIEADELTILYTEAVGAERAILGAMVPLESGEVYFVKLDGPPQRVNDERERFRKFLESFRPAREGAAVPPVKPTATPAVKSETQPAPMKETPPAEPEIKSPEATTPPADKDPPEGKTAKQPE